EVIKIADRVTVLRDGQWVKTAPVSELDAEGIARLMVGRELANLYPAKREPDVDAEIALDVSGLSTGYVRDASFSVRRGEIFGFAGL
ncbi:sugar ABC transporter ATP-binding protein, partial [Acinetobacter baumannii]